MDFTILNWIQENLANPTLDALMPPITHLAEMGIFWLLLGAALMINRDYRKQGVAVISSVALAGLLANLVIKPLVNRMRPFEFDPAMMLLIEAPGSSSFPSGHSAASFAAATVICFMPIKWYWKVAAVTIAALIAFSRMYLYVHFPSDVLGGTLLGITSGLIVVFIGRKFFSLEKEASSSN